MYSFITLCLAIILGTIAGVIVLSIVVNVIYFLADCAEEVSRRNKVLKKNKKGEGE